MNLRQVLPKSGRFARARNSRHFRADMDHLREWLGKPIGWVDAEKELAANIAFLSDEMQPVITDNGEH